MHHVNSTVEVGKNHAKKKWMFVKSNLTKLAHYTQIIRKWHIAYVN